MYKTLYLHTFLLSKFPFLKNNRNSTILKNSLYLLFLKIVSIAINLLYVPLLISFLGQTQYGIWITIGTILAWVSFLDIGLGTGLRNKLAEALANNDIKKAKTLVSTTYFLMSIIFSSVFIVFLLTLKIINWNIVFNTKLNGDTLVQTVFTVVIFFCIRMIVQLLSVVLFADQRTALSNSFNIISNLVSFFLIFMISKVTQGSLLTVAVILSSIPVLTYLVSSFIFYLSRYSPIKPSFKAIDLKYTKEITYLGFKFFIFNLYGIIVVSTTSFIIIQFHGPDEVALYNITLKYFNLVPMLFSIAITPLWPATTEAFFQKDYEWIKITIKKLMKLSFFFCSIICLMLLISEKIYILWVGKSIKIPFLLSFLVATQAAINVLFNGYVIFLKGTGKLLLSIIMITFFLISYYPLIILIYRFLSIGSAGIILASIIAEIPMRLSQPVQYYFIINKNANGIWNK